MLYLLDKDIKTVKWNGIPLHEASSAIVKEEINGDFTLTVRYPITDTGIYQLIKEDMLIKAPSPVLGPQLFRIKEPIENDDSMDIVAYHITDDIMTRSIRPMSAINQACGFALSQMVQNAKTDIRDFSFTSDITEGHTFNTDEDETLYSVLLDGKHSIVGTWEGELVRDNFALNIKKTRGEDRGVIITTHKNLKAYNRNIKSHNVVTRIHARSTFREDGAEEDTTLKVTVDSIYIDDYPYINEREYQNNDLRNVEELRKWAERKFKYEKIDLPSDEIKIEAYELDGQVIHLGDTVNIKSKKHSVDIYKKAIAYEYNALTEEYISITFDDKPGVGGSSVSSGMSNAADVILSANRNAQEVAIERAIRNANQAFDAEFEKRVEEINDGIEQSKAEAERYADAIKQEIATEINDLDTVMQDQSEEHDRQVAHILSKTQSVEALANQAKSDAASAIARANQVKTEAVADARAQVATVSQALNTAKSELQTAIASADQKARDSQASATALRNDLNSQANKILAQAQAQTALTNRVTTVETLADGTRSTVTELSKTVNKATGDIASVSSRTKTVEDTLSQTRTQYEALTQTINTQTGQIESINRKTADLQSGIDGVTERFESLQVGGKNLIAGSKTFVGTHWEKVGTWRLEEALYKGAGVLTWVSGNKVSPMGNIAVDAGEVYTFSAYIKKESVGTVYFYLYDPTESRFATANVARETRINNVGNNFQRFSISFTATRTGMLRPRFAIQNSDTGGFSVAGYQLERGSLPTDYNESTEDFRSEFATYVRNASENSAELVKRIETADGKAVDAKSYAQQTAEGFKTRLESLETYKDAEGTRAQTYFTAAKTETAKQLTAERAVIANNYLAKSVYEEDARGTTLKLNEIKSTADTAKQNLATYQNTVDKKLEELTSSTQTLDGKISTASSKVDTVAGQIRTEISEVEGKIPTGYTGNMLLNSGTGWRNQHSQRFILSDDIKAGETYTVSAYWWRSDNSTLNMGIRPSASDAWQWANLAYSSANDCWTATFKAARTIPAGQSLYFFTVEESGIGSANWATLVAGAKPLTKWQPSISELMTDISSAKTTITNTARGVEQLSTSLATTDDKITTAETEIRNLVDEVSNKVSQTDYNTLTGRVDSAETAISQHADEISKRLTKTQVDEAITDKGYATTTVLENKVKETADSFSRTISETKALIPNNMSNRNLALGTSDSWSAYVSTNSARSNWRVEICRIDFNHYKASVGKKLNLFVHISADNVTLDSSSSHKIAIQAYVLKKDGSVLWHGDTPFHRQWVRDLKSGNNYHIVKLSKEVKPSIYEEGARLVVECRIDGANHVDFHHRAVMVTASDIFPDAWSPAPEDVATVTALHDVKDTVSSHTRTIGAIGETGSILDNVSKVTQTANGLVQEVTGEGGLKTQVSTLKNSWAVKNLSSSGQIIRQINLSEEGFLVDAAKIRLKGKTLVDEIQAIDGKFGTLFVADGTFSKLKSTVISAKTITGEHILFDKAFFDKMLANEALFKTIYSQNAFLTAVQAVTLSASKIQGGIMEAANSAMSIGLNDAFIRFKDNAKIEFQSENNALYRTKNGTSAFIHFRDDSYNGVYTAMGVNADNTGTQNDYSSGSFAGVRVIRSNPSRYSGTTVDQVQLVGDEIRIRHGYGYENDYLVIKWDNQGKIDLIKFLRSVASKLGLPLT